MKCIQNSDQNSTKIHLPSAFANPKKLRSIKILYEFLFDEDHYNEILPEFFFDKFCQQFCTKKSDGFVAELKNLSFQEYFDENQSELHLFKIKRNSIKNSLLLIEVEFFFDKF